MYSFRGLQLVQSKYHPRGKHSALDQTDLGALLYYCSALGVALPKHLIQYTLKWIFLIFLVMHIFCIDFFSAIHIHVFFIYTYVPSVVKPLPSPAHLSLLGCYRALG